MKTLLQNKPYYNASTSKNLSWRLLLAIFLSIVALTVFQDFLESRRSGYSFYISESILFKTVWFLYIPQLAVLNKILKRHTFNSLHKTILLIVASIVTHLIVLTLVFSIGSFIFFNGSYSINKILSYTLANDLYQLFIVYSAFVVIQRFISNRSKSMNLAYNKTNIQNIIISNGKNYTIVPLKDIYKITAETPYVSIHVENKKYLHSETLKSIAIQLENEAFVRIHKSTIVNLEKVVSIKSRLNGDYDILLKNGSELRLSRTYVANFRSKLKDTHQVTI